MQPVGFKRLKKKLCVKLVTYKNCTKMHFQKNIKFSLPVWQNITGHFDIIQLKIVTHLLHWNF